MPYWETVQVVRYDPARGRTWTELVDRFRNDPHEDNPGWAPHYQRAPEPPEHVP